MEKQNIKGWIAALQGIDPKGKNSALARRMVRFASLPRRRRITVDLDKLSAFSKKGENVIVPGKILSRGKIEKQINVSAIDWSEGAEKKLKDAGCTVVKIGEMLKKEGIRVIV